MNRILMTLELKAKGLLLPAFHNQPPSIFEQALNICRVFSILMPVVVLIAIIWHGFDVLFTWRECGFELYFLTGLCVVFIVLLYVRAGRRQEYEFEGYVELSDDWIKTVISTGGRQALTNTVNWKWNWKLIENKDGSVVLRSSDRNYVVVLSYQPLAEDDMEKILEIMRQKGLPT